MPSTALRSNHALAAFLIALLISAITPTSPLHAAEVGAYGQKIAAARSFAAEGSWAKARDGFAEALILAPDNNAAQWCALWVENATWRGEKPTDWENLNTWKLRHESALQAFLKPYAGDSALAYDEFWLAVLQSLADLDRDHGNSEQWGYAVDIADYLAAQPPSPVAAKRYVEFLRDQIRLVRSTPAPDLTSRWLEHLDHASSLAATTDDRGWFALKYAQLAERSKSLPAVDRTLIWQHALAAGNDSIWAPHLRANALIARVLAGRSSDSPPVAPAEVSSLLAEADALSATLATAPDTSESKPLKEALAGLRQWWSGPLFQLDAPQSILPGTPLRVAYGCAGYEKLTVELYQHSPESWNKRGADLKECVRAGIIPAPGFVAKELTQMQSVAQKIGERTIPLKKRK